MTKLEQLIEEFCPDGVEYKKLGDLEDENILKLGRGNVISKIELQQLPGNYPVYSSSSLGDGEIGRYGKYMFDDERITWSIDGGGKFFYRNNIKYSVTNVGGHIKVLSNNLSTKFLYYCLINRWASLNFDYTKKAHPSVIRDIYEIPLPPLPVQKKIVHILNGFTKLIAELQVELTIRKKQYEHYKRNLLTFGEGVMLSPLRNYVNFLNGKGHEKVIDENGKYIVVNSKFISTEGRVKKYSNLQITPIFKESVLMVMSDLPNGRALAKCYFVDKNDTYTLNQRVCSLTVKSNKVLEPKFLYYYLTRNKQLLDYDNGVDQTNLKKDQILNISIPEIALTEQQQIVDILDQFDILCNDITKGLPAEIEMRQKQYEYYRDKLLTFKNTKEEV